MHKNKIIFASYSESIEGLQDICLLADSIRTFGGRFSESPVWACVPEYLNLENDEILKQLKSYEVGLRISSVPENARWFFYAGKPYAAAEAEAAAVKEAPLFAWLDNDSVILDEPDAFELTDSISLGYRPVMHNRSGTLYDSPPNPFWGRIYDKLSLEDAMLFPMITPTDNQKIKAYFQCGMVVVRPEKGIMRQWAIDFEILYNDPVLLKMCREESDKRIFLHQTALVGSILHKLAPEEMVDLTDRYNHPLFFDKLYGAVNSYDSIENIITIRHEGIRDNLDFVWHEKLKGPPGKIEWLKKRLK